MNKLKIAVLDNGVDEKLLALCGLPDIIQQNKGNISDEEDLFLHGTNCAMIIGLNCADAELYSYKLIDNRIIKVVEGLPNLLRVFREGLA